MDRKEIIKAATQARGLAEEKAAEMEEETTATTIKIRPAPPPI